LNIKHRGLAQYFPLRSYSFLQTLSFLICVICGFRELFIDSHFLINSLFSDSRWDIQALKRKRLEIIQKQRTTASTKDGLLAMDDTGCPKPFARKTEGAK